MTRLVRNTIETGAVTAVAAGVELVLFLVIPQTNYHVTPYVDPDITENQPSHFFTPRFQCFLAREALLERFDGESQCTGPQQGSRHGRQPGQRQLA